MPSADSLVALLVAAVISGVVGGIVNALVQHKLERRVRSSPQERVLARLRRFVFLVALVGALLGGFAGSELANGDRYHGGWFAQVVLLAVLGWMLGCVLGTFGWPGHKAQQD